MSSGALQVPVPLQRRHKCDDFDCGSSALNEYLTRFAWTLSRVLLLVCHFPSIA